MTTQETKPKLKPCHMCHNARLDDELTDENDFSSFSVGKTAEGVTMFVTSGYGKPLRIEVLQRNDTIQANETIGVYYPKFCPNCGSPIIEYGGDTK